MTTQVQGSPLAVSHPAGTGTSVKGGHILAWRAQPKFPVDASIALVPGTSNPWREGCEGRKFYDLVLSKATTVQQAIDLGAKLMGLKPNQVQGHLRWIYTDNGAYVTIGGRRWAMPEGGIPVKAPRAPKAPKVAKAKAVA
jgi:hypothetical protein